MTRFCVASCLAVAVAVAPAPASAANLPDGFTIENVVLDPFTSSPIGFAFLPDGRILVIEKDSGAVRVAAPGNTASVVIATIPNLTTQFERGLLGIAVDPGWPARPYVYFHATRVGGVIQIFLMVASGDLDAAESTNLALGSPYLLLADIPDLASTHNGGTLRFGPDGFLYVSLGEDVRPCEAQNLEQPRGKILRLDVSQMPGEGPGPPSRAALAAAGNPFPGGDWQRLVWAYGLRNPYRFTIDPQSGALCIGDVGHLTWEEVDLCPATGPGGINYGWPEYEGSLQHPDPSAMDCSFEPFEPPIHAYPHSDIVAVVCGPRLRTGAGQPRAFPSAYDGDIFFTDFYGGGWIRRLHESGGTWSIADSVAGQPNAQSWVTEIGAQIADLQQGPDGALYFMNFVFGGVPRGVHRVVSTLPSDISQSMPGDGRLRLAPNPARRGRGVRIERPAWHEASRTLRARIIDPAGRAVRTWHSAAGGSSLRWDGRTDAGRIAAPGVYFVEIRAPEGPVERRKLVVTR